MIRLVCSDLDGTLLPTTDADVAPADLALIGRMREAGIRFMPVSGRQYRLMRELFRDEAGRLDYIAENGCLVIHDGEIVRRETMPRESALRRIAEASARPEYGILVSGVEHAYIKASTPAFAAMCRDFCRVRFSLWDDLTTIPEPYFKISLWVDDIPHITERLSAWRELFAGELTVVYGGNGWIDFSALGTTKGKALTWYMETYGYQPSEVAMFGDNDNDETALAAVTYSYAMAQAPETLKSRCFGTTDSVGRTLKTLLADRLG